MLYGISAHSADYVGEAVYVDDIPSPSNCLHGAFIYSTEPLARVKGISFKAGLSRDGVTALISVKDIPGENVGCTSILGDEPLYADEVTQCAGDRIAFVVILWFHYLPFLVFAVIVINIDMVQR